MGYGNGYNARNSRFDGATNKEGKRVASIFDNAGCAHAWNAQTQNVGQSSNGNLYFTGAELYSYGSHFLCGFIMPDGVALLNADSYSVATSGHMGDAWSATSNRPRYSIKGLTNLESLLDSIKRGRVVKDTARRMIREHAEELAAACLLGANDSRYSWNFETRESFNNATGESAGAYLTRACGLPATSWPKLAREAAAIKAKREAAQAKASADTAKRRAIRLADMAAPAWRRALSVIDAHGATYNAHGRLKSLALELHRATRVANALGFSAKRRATIKARKAEARERLANVESIAAIVDARSRVRSDIAAIRSSESTWREMVKDGELPDYHRIRNLAYVAKNCADLSDSLGFPPATRERLAFASRRIESTRIQLAAEQAERSEAERIETARVRELELESFKLEWKEGTAPLASRRFDSDHGGAAIRINGARLETSHGAAVPLKEAIRVFRFVKLVMARGEAWRRNGAEIRVGAFNVDSIEPSGAFVAGCHSFAWQEVKAAAIAAGVFDIEPSAEVVTHKELI